MVYLSTLHYESGSYLDTYQKHKLASILYMVESSSLILSLVWSSATNCPKESGVRKCHQVLSGNRTDSHTHLTLDSEDRILQPDEILDPSGVSRQQSA
jgi:hypothetical protein